MSLCSTCRNATIYTRKNNRTVTLCGAGDWGYVPVPGDIETCSQYDDKRTPSRWDMDRIAWTLRTGPSGQIRGFTPPKRETDGT